MTASERASLAETIDDLFRTVLKDPDSETEYPLRDVEAWCLDNGYGSIKPETMRTLRKGYRENPTAKTLAAIAAFFGVPTSSLVDDASRAHLREQLAALRDDVARGVQGAPLGERMAQQQMLARRAGALTEAKRQVLFDFLDIMHGESSDEGPSSQSTSDGGGSNG